MAEGFEIPEAARGFSAFRALKDGRGRAYTSVYAEGGYRSARMMVNRFRAVGAITTAPVEPYAILDVLDDDGDVIADFRVPTSRGFAYIKRQLHLTVASTDGDPR